jgi:hypothetical protein
MREAVDVVGQPVELHGTSELRLVLLHDTEHRVVEPFRAVDRPAVEEVGLAFRSDHRRRDGQAMTPLMRRRPV